MKKIDREDEAEEFSVRTVVGLFIFSVLDKSPGKNICVELLTRYEVIIFSRNFGIALRSWCICWMKMKNLRLIPHYNGRMQMKISPILTRNGCSKTIRIGHQPLSYVMPPIVRWANQDNRSLMRCSRVIQCDFFICKNICRICVICCRIRWIASFTVGLFRFFLYTFLSACHRRSFAAVIAFFVSNQCSLLERFALMLECLARYQTSQCVLFFALAVRLPPVRIILWYHVQNITFLEAKAKLTARYILIILGIVIEMSPNMYDIRVLCGVAIDDVAFRSFGRHYWKCHYSSHRAQ